MIKNKIKRIICIAAAVMLAVSAAIIPASGESLPVVTYSVTSGETTHGQTFSVTMSVGGCSSLKSIRVRPQYDTAVLELTSMEWLIEGTSISGVDGGVAVAAYSTDRSDISGEILRCDFKVLSDAPIGESDISFDTVIKSKASGTEQTISCTVQDKITITVGHTFGATSGGKKTCTVCGFVSDLRVGTYTVVFESSLTVNLKIRKDVFTAGGYTDPYIVAEKLGTTYVLTESYEEESYIVFPFKNHPPQTMGDLFTFTVHATKDGEAVVSEEYQSASICSYIASVWGQSTTTDALKTMLADLLSYGYEAQLVKNHNTDAPVTDCIDAAELAEYATAADPTLENVTSAKYVELDGATAAWKTYSLTLDSAIQLNLFFTLDGNDTTGITVELRNEAGDLLETVAAEDLVYESSSGRYQVKFIKLDATKMYDSVYATVCRDGVVISNTMRTSIASYAKVLIDGGSDLADVAKAMMKYGAAAVAYGG